jgi:hypothetical protein
MLSGWEDDSWNEQGWNDSRPFDVEEPAVDDLTGADLLAWALVGHGSSKAAGVEVLAAYSHSAQAAELWLCHTLALTSPVCPETEAKRPGSLQDRLDERDLADRIAGYREGVTRHSRATRGMCGCCYCSRGAGGR